MSDDTQQDDEPVIIGDAVQFAPQQLQVSPQDIDDAVEWWDTVASPLFVGVLEE